MPGWPDFDHWFPPVETPERRPAPPYAMRRPAADDHARCLRLLAAWLEQPALPHLLGGALLRQMAGVSWLAETDDRRPIGLLLGIIGPDGPREGAIALVAVDPALRRRGIGRSLVNRFIHDAVGRGIARVVVAVRPDERTVLAFFAALGFEPDAGPGSARIHGVPAFADWDGPGQDRALLVRSTGTA